MAGISGVCPQRRASKSVDADGLGELCISVAKDSVRDNLCLRQESMKTDLGRQDAEARQSWLMSSQRLVRILFFFLAIFFLVSSTAFLGAGVVLERANHLGRQCSSLELHRRHDSSRKPFRFAMVTCSDGSNKNPHRSFEGLMDLVTPNKKSYVERHGYDFIDASDVLDKERPPSWSKILAVMKHLPNYDWVFWNDVDSVVTNPSIALEDIIHSVVGDTDYEHMPDFIVTEDVTGVNAGMFFVRNSEWSRQFFERWWNQTSFIQPPGLSKSGDNDALKALINSMPSEERQGHVRVPRMQCLFNSNLWRPSWRSRYRLITIGKSVWQGVYAKGDFMVHLAGLNDKKKWMKKVLLDTAEQRAPSRIKHRKTSPPERH